MTATRQVTVFYRFVSVVACLSFVGTMALTILAVESIHAHGIDFRELSTLFFGMYIATAPILWFLSGAGLMDAAIKRISDGSRPGPRLRTASFEPPRRRAP